MKSIFFVLAICFLFIPEEACSQKDKSKKKIKSGTVNPVHKQDFESRAERKAKHSKSKKYNSREAFYKRLELNSKEQLKNERRGMNPRYSDQTYFGHKRLPKNDPFVR